MRYIIGLLIVLLGVQLLLEASGVKNVPDVGDWWPMILIAAGVGMWWNNQRQIFGPLILIAVGGIFLFNNLGIISGDVWNYLWPSILVLFGLRILLGRSWDRPSHKNGDGRQVFAAFSGTEEKVHGKFTGGNVSAWFGGSKLDLRDADITDRATIDVSIGFGEVEIIVPRDVRVETHVTPIFGGASNKTSINSEATKTLIISGTAVFGGVEIKN